MFKRLSNNLLFLSLLSGVLVFLSFEKFNLVPLILFFPVFLNEITFRASTGRAAFAWGFLVSFIIMLGGFYWVIYVIHEFGYLPWSVSVLLFLGFCGFGALNFPLFAALASYINRRIYWDSRNDLWRGLWFTLVLPALFTASEYFIPKLFPWYVSHCFYRQPLLFQIADTTGCTFLTFILYSLGSAFGAAFYKHHQVESRLRPVFLLIPLTLWGINLGYGAFKLNESPGETRPLKVALIQPNIGSLEKMNAEMGHTSKRQAIWDRYTKLTASILPTQPDLIVWPETAMPFHLNKPGEFQDRLREQVLEWKVPLITGGFSQGKYLFVDYNAAYLFEPQPDHTLKTQAYFKNILLAFGEYFPLGEWIPKLYVWFPQVSHFARGTEQLPFTLSNGSKIGITICYEGIVPSFFRKGAQHPIQAAFNLTNDSWFGPTSEPFLHGSLTTFRAVESRLPLARVTNTGISFFVDRWGRRSENTPVYEQATLVSEMQLPVSPQQTFYVTYGDWFILVIGVILIATFIATRRQHDASLSH